MTSENGWEPAKASPEQCEWITVPGTGVSLQLLKGWPSAIMRAYAADYHQFVEPLRDADSAGWTPTNAVATSNHLNGTAMDLNWNSHPFRVADAGYTPAMIATMNEILDFYEDTMFWANRWDSPKDAMHHQMGYGSYNNPHTGDFIARKIRADGYSTFRRGSQPQPTGKTVPLTALPNGRWTSPSPAWAHLINRESGGNPTIIQQIHDVNSGGNEAEGLFQITPRTWRGAHGDEFAASPRHATPQQQAIVAARIFVRNPSGSDWGAGLPGREDPRELAAGLVPLTADTPTTPQPQEGGFLMALSDAQQRELYETVCGRRPSQSPLRPPGDTQTYNMRDMVDFADGSVHVLVAALAARLGHPNTLALLEQDAAADLNTYPDRAGDKQLAQAILAEAASGAPGVVEPPTQLPPAPAPVVVYQPPVEPAHTNGNSVEPTTGQLIGDAYDALEKLRLADALPIEGRAPLAALISVLQVKNGSQL